MIAVLSLTNENKDGEIEAAEGLSRTRRPFSPVETAVSDLMIARLSLSTS
jgi:hypothetical protein